MSDSLKTENLTEQDTTLIKRVLAEAEQGDREFLDSLSPSEKGHVLEILREFSEEGYSAKLNEIYEIDYDENPVDIETFVYDEHYMGKILGDNLYPRWLEHMKEFLDPSKNYIEVALTGSIGSGKTTVGLISKLFHMHRVLCLRNPQGYYNLMDTDEIVFAIFNATLELADNVGYQKIANMVKSSPFFKERLIHNPRSPEQINFPKNISIEVGSKFSHALGKHIFGASIDEANFQEADLDENDTSQVMKTYNAIYRRMESRFLQKGGTIPGQLYLISSKNEESSFLEVHVEKHRDKGTTYVVDEPIWNFKSHLGIYSGKKFRVMVGDQKRDSQILEKGEKAPDGYQVVEVPIEYKESFEREVDSSLKDIAGIATYSDSNLIKNRQRVRDCIVRNIEDFGEWHSPFTKDLIVLDFDDDDTEIEDFIDKEYFKRYLGRVGFNKPRAIHIDIGVSGDALGFGMAHIAGKTTITETDVLGNKSKTEREVYRVDLMTRVTNLDGKELPLIKVLSFVKWIRKIGVNIRVISTDGYQSTMLRQLLRKQGFETKLISVDKNDDAYVYLKDAHMDYRVQMYEYQPYLTELFDLLHDRKKNKVDHQKKNSDGSRGSKDISDAVAGAIYDLVNDDIQVKNSDNRPIDYGAFQRKDRNELTPEEDAYNFAIGDYQAKKKQREENKKNRKDNFRVF